MIHARLIRGAGRGQMDSVFSYLKKLSLFGRKGNESASAPLTAQQVPVRGSALTSVYC